MKVFISGSRSCNDAMRTHARKVVERVKLRGYTVIVGDAPGIDTEVINHCDRIGVPVIVLGAYGRLRHRTSTGENVFIEGNYTERDERLVHNCDMFYGIWNGKSKGTDRNWKRCIQEGKHTLVYLNGKVIDVDSCKTY